MQREGGGEGHRGREGVREARRERVRDAEGEVRERGWSIHFTEL